MYLYPAVLQPPDENGDIVVTFPDVPEAITFGNSQADALRHASDALDAALSFYIDAGKDLPVPSRPRGRRVHLVGVSALSDAKLQLYTAVRASGVRKSELARRMGIAKTNVDRLFDLNRSSRFEQIEAAFRALGKRVVIGIKEIGVEDAA
jgi:antitoxin HicB